MHPAKLLKGREVGRRPNAVLSRRCSSDGGIEAEAVQQVGGGSIGGSTLHRKAGEVRCKMLIEVKGQEHSPIPAKCLKRQPVLCSCDLNTVLHGMSSSYCPGKVSFSSRVEKSSSGFMPS